MILGSKIMADDSDVSKIADFIGLTSLFNILSLMSEGIAGFDANGTIVIANEAMGNLTGLYGLSLLGTNIRDIVLTREGEPAEDGFWPFATDGEKHELYVKREDAAALVPVSVRAKQMGEMGEKGSFLLICHSLEEFEEEHEVHGGDSVNDFTVMMDLNRMEQLARVQKTMHGGDDQDSLLSTDAIGYFRELIRTAGEGSEAEAHLKTVTDELITALDADTAAIYLREKDDYRLVIASGDGRNRMPVNLGNQIKLTKTNGNIHMASRLVVKDPAKAGKGGRDLIHIHAMDTGDEFLSPARNVPALSSFLAEPISFEDGLDALFIAGWIHPHEITSQERRFMETLSVHLVSDVMNGIVQLAAEKSDKLNLYADNILKRLANSAKKELTAEDYDHVLQRFAKRIRSVSLPLEEDSATGRTYVSLTEDGRRSELPVDMNELMEAHGKDGVAVVQFALGSSEAGELTAWLSQQGLEPRGAIVVVEELAGGRRSYLILPDNRRQSLEELELATFRRLLMDMSKGDTRRRQNASNEHISQSLQHGMVSSLDVVEGVTAEAVFNSSTIHAEVGGDFYDMFALSGNKVCIVLGDTAGKGIGVASVSAMARSALRAYVWQDSDSPALVASRLNDLFVGINIEAAFVCVNISILDLSTGDLIYCSAGTMPGMLVRTSRHEIEELSTQSGVLGFSTQVKYRNGHLTMEKGDKLVLYTDGVTDARTADGKHFFGEKGLRDALVDLMDEDVNDIPHEVVDRVFMYAQNSVDDDLTVMAVQYDGVRIEEAE